jgi:uroporphyrinogen-III decarboxylase
MMTSKERMLCALGRDKPDRLPVSIHQWQPYHLEKHLGGISALEAFAKFGMDAQIQYFESMGQFWLIEADYTKFSTRDWFDDATIVSADPDNRVVHHTIRTPEGTLTYKTAGNRMTTWITEALIKHDDDIELIRKYMPVPQLDLKPIVKIYDEVGDRGILRGFVWGDQVGCWQHACCLADVNDLIMRCYDQPDWVHALLKILLEKKLRFVETMKGAKFDLVETGGGGGSSTVISPALHEQFCLPYDRQIHDALHSLGFKITYHTCGGTLGIEESIVANGCDASETLAPKSIGGNQEPWEFAAKIAGRVALIGGVDQFNLVSDGTPRQIRDMVHKLFATCGARGGYICSLSDHFFETAPEKLQAFADAARECVY